MWKYHLLDVVFLVQIGLGNIDDTSGCPVFVPLIIPIWWLWFHTLWFTLIHPPSLMTIADFVLDSLNMIQRYSKANAKFLWTHSGKRIWWLPKPRKTLPEWQHAKAPFGSSACCWTYEVPENRRIGIGIAMAQQQNPPVFHYEHIWTGAWIFGSWFHSLLNIST